LGKYLKPFIAKVASITPNREIYCIDAFAGTAKYEDENVGSPLLMAEVSDECAGWKDPVTLKIINVEANVENFKSLQSAMKSWEDLGIVTNINSEFQDAIPEILNIIGNAPALFFIDPFGSTSVHFSHLKPILQRTQKITELITNFDTDGLYRIACAAISKNVNPKTAETNEQNINEIIGSNGWKEVLLNKKLTTKEGERFLLREYMENLTTYGYHVVAYPIREALNKKSKYHFVYCTRHTDGIILVNDFIREEDDLIYGF
jgi:three-Cys-motif partner protein